MSKSVFISHAVKDKDLAQEVVDLIEEGIGVPEAEIFCSSLDGYGIPSGKNFVTYIREQLLEPEVVVLLLTPSYFESKFCLSELGAAWIKSHQIFPILVPPLQYSDVKDVLLGTQVAKIDDDIKYNELRETLASALKLTPKSLTKWDTKRREFLKAIAPILKNIAGPTTVSAAEFKAKVDMLEESQTALAALEKQIVNLKARLSATEALKDKADLSTLKGSHGDEDVSKRFNDLTNEIKSFRSVLKGAEVMKFVLSKHYGKPYQVDWYGNREEFEAAARFGFVVFEDGERVNWSKRQMKELGEKLDELDAFISEYIDELQESEEEDVPLEADAQDFWEYHYDV